MINSPTVCTRSQTSRTASLEELQQLPTTVPVKAPNPKPPSQPDFRPPNMKDKRKPEMSKKTSKAKIDYTKVTSDTPPKSLSSSSTSINVEQTEPCNPAPSSLRMVDKMTDKEMVEHLSKNVPELKDEGMFLYQCPEKIGLEPLRDILVNQSKTWKQSINIIKAIVVGLKSGLNYSLREQHRSYLEMFGDMKVVMMESSLLMTEVSKSLSETLKNENKESGKTLSALKEVFKQRS